MPKSVSIVIVNFNGHFDTVECLESVLKSRFDDFKVFVVDNSPDEDSSNFIHRWAKGEVVIQDTKYPHLIYPLEPKPLDYAFVEEENLFRIRPDSKITVIKAKNNLGFAAANNIALKYISQFDRSSFVWLLNNDTVIERDTLRNLVNFAIKSDNHVGIFGSKLIQYFSPNTLQAVGGLYYKWVGKVKEIGSGQWDLGQWDQVHFNFDYVVGASMFIRMEFLSEVGLMEEDYFLYYEEIDWATRGKEKGWRQAFCPGAIIYHKQGSSTGSKKNSLSVISDYYSIRNRILLAKRFFPYTIPSLYISFGLFIFNRLKQKRIDRIKMFFEVVANPARHYKNLTN